MYKYIKRNPSSILHMILEINRQTASAIDMIRRDRIFEEVINNSQMLGGRDEFRGISLFFCRYRKFLYYNCRRSS
jgi:hypothetical protein